MQRKMDVCLLSPFWKVFNLLKVTKSKQVLVNQKYSIGELGCYESYHETRI